MILIEKKTKFFRYSIINSSGKVYTLLNMCAKSVPNAHKFDNARVNLKENLTYAECPSHIFKKNVPRGMHM